MARRESRTSTGRTNRSQSAMSLCSGGGPAGHDSVDSPVFSRSKGTLSASAEMLRIGTGIEGGEKQRSRSSMGHDTGLSISAGKRGQGVEPVQGDALDRLLGSSQRRTREGETIISSSRFSPSIVRCESELQARQSPASDVRAAFLAPPMTPNAVAKARLEKIRARYSKELAQLQLQLMSDQGRPFSALQKALVYNTNDGEIFIAIWLSILYASTDVIIVYELSACAELFPSASPFAESTEFFFVPCAQAGISKDDALKNALWTATGGTLSPSDALIQELRTLSRAEPGKQVDYKQVLQVIWDDKHVEVPMGGVKPGRENKMKYMFLVGSGAGCYNDNIEPQPSLFGVKKGSSSVRYSLFTNKDVDVSTTFKLVPADMMRAVDADMKMSVAQHPSTGRPLDPWLSYLAVSQGKKCDNRPPDQVCHMHSSLLERMRSCYHMFLKSCSLTIKIFVSTCNFVDVRVSDDNQEDARVHF